MPQILTDETRKAFRFTVELAIRPIIRKVYGRRAITDQQTKVWAAQVVADILRQNWIVTQGPPAEPGGRHLMKERPETDGTG